MTQNTPPATVRDRPVLPRLRGPLAGLGLAVLLLVVLHVTGALETLQRALAPGAEGRPDSPLLGVVDVFSCCILSWKVFTTMLPAFLLAGAITAFVPTSLILRYLGARAGKVRAYSVAAVSGVILSLCSCNIVPLFVSIYRLGAGLGPACTFLYAGPAINMVAVIFTAQVLGWQLGLWRGLGVPLIAVAAGLIMAGLFRRDRTEDHLAAVAPPPEDTPAPAMGRVWALFALLLGLVLYGAWDMAWGPKLVGMGVLLGAAGLLLGFRFERGELGEWMGETWGLLKMVLPVLLPAVIIIGLLAAYVDVKLVYRLVGPAPADSGFLAWLRPILLGDLFGALMYFPILSEVAFVRTFFGLGMDTGPALAVLLTGAGLSLPGLIIVGRAIGWRKTLAYQAVIILLTTGFAAFFASEVGQYICACMMLN